MRLSLSKFSLSVHAAGLRHFNGRSGQIAGLQMFTGGGVDLDNYRKIFYRATLNARQSSREKGVCPSVHLSVKHVDSLDCDETQSREL